MSQSKRASMAEDPPRASVTSMKGSRKGSIAPKALDLDDVLVNELGQLGWFQIKNILLVSLPIMMSAFMSEYIFSAATIPHRCQIPECGEIYEDLNYDQSWLSNAIPLTSSGGFASCERYQPLRTNGSLTQCPAILFDQSNRIECDRYVYNGTNSVVYEFDLGCDEWMRAFAGMLHSIGTLLVLPFTGYVSDRWGRRIALVISIFNLALIGLIRAFSINYPMYLVFQLLQTTLGAGTLSSAYIFAAEYVGPKYRVLNSSVVLAMFAVGQVTLGAVSWAIPNWRLAIIALHAPCFLIVSYYWFLSESVRWLLSKRRFDEAKEVLEKVAKLNKTKISEESLYQLMNPPNKSTDQEESTGLIQTILSSRILLRRVCTTPIWWITTTFVYYGLSINSTGLSDNMHLNYILTCAVEIPGFLTSSLILNIIGRKATLSAGYFLCAACNIAFVFMPNDLTIPRLVVFLFGKFCISAVFASLYLYTSELYPTTHRHTLLAFSSMIGRIGSIVAPLTPPLAEYWDGIPSVMFGAMGALSGVLVLTQPETLGTKLPDTLEEAEALGTPESKLKTKDNSR